eukprot:scaffold29260_cov49-Attheya_sp.AAC.1
MAGETVLDCLARRDHMLLLEVVTHPSLADSLVEAGDNGKSPTLSEKEQSKIVTQCMYLRNAYEVSAMRMNGWTWQQCCEEAISILAHAGIKKAAYRRHPTKNKSQCHPSPLLQKLTRRCCPAKCYDNLCDEDFGDEGPLLLLPTYIEVIAMLRLTTVSPKTAWNDHTSTPYSKNAACSSFRLFRPSSSLSIFSMSSA